MIDHPDDDRQPVLDKPAKSSCSNRARPSRGRTRRQTARALQSPSRASTFLADAIVRRAAFTAAAHFLPLFKERIWGGRRLETLFGKESAGERAHRRIVGNRRSPGSTKRRPRRPLAGTNAPPPLEKLSTRSLRRNRGRASLSAVPQIARRARTSSPCRCIRRPRSRPNLAANRKRNAGTWRTPSPAPSFMSA